MVQVNDESQVQLSLSYNLHVQVADHQWRRQDWKVAQAQVAD